MAVYFVCYIISFILARQHAYMLSGLVLITAALWLYYRDYMGSGNILHLRGLFCLFFVGGQGISCFKLSRLQGDWDARTWICLGLAVGAFWGVFEALSRQAAGAGLGFGGPAIGAGRGSRGLAIGAGRGSDRMAGSPRQAGRLLKSMAVLTAISWLAFAFEAWKLGFIPLFSYGVPHAYSYFHVSGVHYFTVACVLVPSLSVVYLPLAGRSGRGTGRLGQKKGRRGGFWIAMALNVLALAIPVLCVSRFQLILAVGMAAFTYISMAGNIRPVYVAALIGCMVPAYLLLTVMRSHSVEYLNSIFEMKDSGTPIFITQPYMYIANNYDNFNCLVEQLPSHTWGLRMLFPLWAFTGLKFKVPSLVDFPLFVTKKELTTVTLFYDAYYDFGLAGMAAFGALLGAACFYLVKMRKKLRCPAGHLIYAQIAMYMVLSFFTTWFSNPATWFYLVVTGMIYLYVRS